MRKTLFTLLMLLGVSLMQAAEFNPEAQWITASQGEVNQPGTWLAFRQDVKLGKVPSEVLANIAADSRYWLWINGKQVVFEGSLKRGPTPQDSYYDQIDLTPYLKKGNNQIAVLLWYFGKSGFSHTDSGKSGILFSADAIGLYSGRNWLSRIHPAYGVCGDPKPNYRLSESSIHFDARQDIGKWQTADLSSLDGFNPSTVLGHAGDAPWNRLLLRPIPQWKDYGQKAIKYERHAGPEGDTLVCRLPYNMHITPAVTLQDNTGGHLVRLETDHVRVGSETGVRAEYVTRSGEQTYESLGWMNGDFLYVIVPEGVEVKKIMYRQTGYDGLPEGAFTCDDDYFNRFWLKGLRTLYVNMRDTFYDCPERERAQWWGDVTILMGECFNTYSTKVHQLMRKGILELAAFQHKDGALSSPIPGTYKAELPAQMLASVSLYGFWNYYMNTGDKEVIEAVYPAVRRYLDIWKLDETGLTAERHGGWDWGDWGDHRDIRLLYAGWHYMALESAARMADLLDKPVEADAYRQFKEQVKKGYNACWDGKAYRHPSFKGDTDDRVQALAVVSGIADADKYDQIFQLLHTQKHASPYMEKYVMEALFQMGHGDFGMERVRERFNEMVMDPVHTTLYEGWGIGPNGFGGGTTNHAWSGGALTIISQYLMGVKPVEAGWTRFEVNPQIVTFNEANISIPTVKGMVETSFQKQNGKITLKVTVPHGTEGLLYLPTNSLQNVRGKLDGVKLLNRDDYQTLGIDTSKYLNTETAPQKKGKICLLLPAGHYKYVIQ